MNTVPRHPNNPISLRYCNLSQSEIMSKCVVTFTVSLCLPLVLEIKRATNDESNVEEPLAHSIGPVPLFFFEDPLYAVFGLGTDGLYIIVITLCHDPNPIPRTSPRPKSWQSRNGTSVISRGTGALRDLLRSAFRILYTSLALSMPSYFPSGSSMLRDICEL
jgi:hypothetical protein